MVSIYRPRSSLERIKLSPSYLLDLMIPKLISGLSCSQLLSCQSPLLTLNLRFSKSGFFLGFPERQNLGKRLYFFVLPSRHIAICGIQSSSGSAHLSRFFTQSTVLIILHERTKPDYHSHCCHSCCKRKNESQPSIRPSPRKVQPEGAMSKESTLSIPKRIAERASPRFLCTLGRIRTRTKEGCANSVIHGFGWDRPWTMTVASDIGMAHESWVFLILRIGGHGTILAASA
jgi:hypothetical protein